MTALLELVQSDGIRLKRAAAYRGGTYKGACPFCGEGEDRFSVYPNWKGGRFKCYQCGKGGDAIQYLRERRGMGYKEACQALNVEPKPMTGGALLPRTLEPEWHPSPFTKPNDTWRDRARKFRDRAVECLWSPEHHDRLQWLRDRGLSDRTILEFELGYCPKEYYEDFSLWGFSIEGMVKVLRGIVIPCMRAGHGLFKVKFRRNNEDMEAEQGKKPQKYGMIQSDYGDNPRHDAPYTISSLSSKHWFVVESELDAILLWQEGYGLGIGVIALGGASKKPDSDLHNRLLFAESILFCRDFDDAGKKALAWWQEHYPNVKNHPTEKGKDPTEALQAGCDVRTWVRAGLPNPYPDMPGFETLDKTTKVAWRKEVIRLQQEDSELMRWQAEQIAYALLGLANNQAS